MAEARLWGVPASNSEKGSVVEEVCSLPLGLGPEEAHFTLLLMHGDIDTSNFRKLGEIVCVQKEEEQSLIDNYSTFNSRVSDLLL